MKLPLWKVDPKWAPPALRKIAEKEIHTWLPGWLAARARARLRRPTTGTKHLLFAVCDHYEPLHGGAGFEQGLARVREWRERYPTLMAPFRDANGRAPRHTFFFPGDQYDPRFVEPLGELADLGFGEVEVHLHHQDDTHASLRAKFEQSLEGIAAHGLLPERAGKPAWAFIHGDWALANGRRDRRMCGVDDELALLWELGCYADFTFPSAPDQTQPNWVNCIYYPEDVHGPRGYEHGERVAVGTMPRDRVMLVQGPLAPRRRVGSRKPWDISIENGALDFTRGLELERLRTWVAQDVIVEGRPEWVFVKVYTHGAPEPNAELLLGDGTAKFHQALLEEYGRGSPWNVHYVSAREMFNVARAAMDGKSGSPAAWFDYEIPPPPRLQPKRRVAG